MTARSMPTGVASRARSRQGFTLVELMVALTLGALVIASVYTLGAASSRHFQEQQRVSQLQLATRIGLERVRRDASLAGFGSSPNSSAERACGTVPGIPTIYGARVIDHDGDGESALATMDGAAGSGVHADRLRMTGNFDTGDVYLVRDYNGVTINLQMAWQGFRRSFVDPAASTDPDEDLFQAVFDTGRVVRITHPTAGTFFAEVGTASTSATNATITLTASLPACADVCLGCTIAPVTGVEYYLDTAPAILQPTIAAAVSGNNTALMRGLFDPVTDLPIPNTARPVLEWAIHFDVDALVNVAAPTLIPNVVLQDDATVDGAGALRASGIYALDVTLGARTPEQDRGFPWVAPVPGAPITRFRASTTLPGAMRVRTARAEILLPNIAYRGM